MLITQYNRTIEKSNEEQSLYGHLDCLELVVYPPFSCYAIEKVVYFFWI